MLGWGPDSSTLGCLRYRIEHLQSLALLYFKAGNTNEVKMSSAQKARKGRVGYLGGNYEPKDVSFPLFSTHSPQDDCGITGMPLSTSGLLVLRAPDGCPQGSLQLSINMKPGISKGVPMMPRCVVPEQFRRE